MWPDEAESLEDAAAGDPSSAGGGGGGSGSSSHCYLDEGRRAGTDEEERPSAVSESKKQPQGEAGAGSSEDGTMGADGGLREEWELMATDEKVSQSVSYGCKGGNGNSVAVRSFYLDRQQERDN